MNHQLIMRAQHYYEQSQQAEEQLVQVQEQLRHLGEFQKSLTLFEKPAHKEIFAALGRGIFFPAEIKGNEMLVDVGAGVFVKKTVAQAHILVEKQIKRLHELKQTLQSLIDSLTVELESLARELEKMRHV